MLVFIENRKLPDDALYVVFDCHLLAASLLQILWTKFFILLLRCYPYFLQQYSSLISSQRVDYDIEEDYDARSRIMESLFNPQASGSTRARGDDEVVHNDIWSSWMREKVGLLSGKNNPHYWEKAEAKNVKNHTSLFYIVASNIFTCRIWVVFRATECMLLIKLINQIYMGWQFLI